MPKSVTDQYAELMHYTNAAGLVGIVSSSTIWATHANFLNDSEEIKHFFDVRLFDLVLQEELQYKNNLSRSADRAKKMLAEGGVDHLARVSAVEHVKDLRSATLRFNQPFIFSMSAASDEPIARNGLLSQWRGYGKDGGYAIVFDTEGFDPLLKCEGETNHYQHYEWVDVFYHGVDPATQPSSEDVARLEATVRKGLPKIIRSGAVDEGQGFYQAISSLSCRYKHRGFFEEREVRLVAIPVTEEIEALAKANGEGRQSRKPKTFVRSGMPVPYLELFSELPESPRALPIKRVIVGPHRDQDLRVDAVRRLLASKGYEAYVEPSDIPYLGR